MIGAKILGGKELILHFSETESHFWFAKGNLLLMVHIWTLHHTMKATGIGTHEVDDFKNILAKEEIAVNQHFHIKQKGIYLYQN